MFAVSRSSIGAVFALLCTFLKWTSADEIIPIITNRIVGGIPAASAEIPYIVSLTVYGTHNCGGSIINKLTILTAAHCLANIQPSLMQVHAGSISREGEDGVLVNVLDTHYNKNWTAKSMDYDVGIVRLTDPLVYSKTIQPIRLPMPGQDIVPGSLATVAGWGYINEKGPSSMVLKKAPVPIVSQGSCDRLFSGSITKRMVCAGYLDGGIDACRMDSGGPLVQKNVLIGIVSWGIGCAEPNAPGVYARVPELLPWIQKVMAEKYKEGINDD